MDGKYWKKGSRDNFIDVCGQVSHWEKGKSIEQETQKRQTSIFINTFKTYSKQLLEGKEFI